METRYIRMQLRCLRKVAVETDLTEWFCFMTVSLKDRADGTPVFEKKEARIAKIFEWIILVQPLSPLITGAARNEWI